MRLIDADEVLDNIEDMWCDDCSLCGGKCRFPELRNMISTYPTAYDVDKVVEQLQKYRGNFESRGILPLVNMDYAVEVVRNGGKE